MLWGNLPEFLEMPILETRLKLHTPAAGIDADFTIEGGRIFLSTKKADKPSIVRVRFKTEIWDITLPNDQTEMILDLFGRYPPGVPFSRVQGGEGPQAEFYAGVLKGSASFRVGMSEFASVAGPSVLIWDNKGNGKSEPIKMEGIPPQWSKVISNDPASRDFIQELEAALLDFSKRLSRKEADVEVVLAEAVSGAQEKWSRRVLAVFCLESLDALTYLADALGDAEHPESRSAAVMALRHWIGGSPERDLQLHAVLVGKKGFGDKQADFVLTLLHSFSREEIGEAPTYAALIALLDHDKVAVRELAWWHLSRLDAEGARDKKLMFNAAFPDDARARVVAEWKKRIPDGKLPPRPEPKKN